MMGKKHPVPANEAMRLNALRDYEIIDSKREKEFDRITELVSLICNVPIALITLVDENRQWFKSKIGVETDETPRQITFCQYTIMQEELLEVEDTLLDDRFVDNILVTHEPNIRFYAGYPLTDPAGYNLGSVCVLDQVPRKLSVDQKRSIELLAKNVIDLIIKRRQKRDILHFERMFRLSSDLICIYRPESKFILINPALSQLTGLNEEKIKNGLWKASIHPDDCTTVITALNHCLVHHTKSTTTVQVLSTDGTYKNIEWVISVEPATGHFLGVGRDVKNTIDLKSKLRHTQQLLQETNQVARIGGWELDVINRKMTWTDMTRRIHGVTASYQPSIEKSITFYQQEDDQAKIKLAMENAITYGTAWSLELLFTDTTGSSFWVQSIGKVEIKNGKSRRIYGTIQDIDEKKKVQLENEKSKAILQAFVWHNPAAVAMLDRNMCYVAVSRAWLSDFGLTNQDVTGKLHYDIFPFITSSGKARHQRILAGVIEKNPEDADILKGSDFYEYASWEMRPWYMTDGSIGGIMIFIQDVTHLVEQREQLKTAKLEAESATKVKQEFLANISHELRTPLNGILGFAELASYTDTEEARNQYLNLVIKSGHSLLDRINDILDYSKIASGVVDLVLERTDLHSLIKQAISRVAAQAQAKNLHITSDLQSGLQRFIWTDVMRIGQVLYNLLSNAIKFTDVGEVSLRVDRLYEQHESTTFRFSVSDTGIGIHPENQALIFDAFTQEDGSLTRRHEGTGLGLTVSHKLLETMNSVLKLESTPQVGSTFHFDLTVRASHY